MNVKSRTRCLVLIVLGGLLSGCEGCHSHEHEGDSLEHAGHDEHSHEDDRAAHEEHSDHGHDSDEVTLRITRWTEKLELFAEHAPPIKGEKSKFVSHLTLLSGFKPLENATVTLILDGPSHAEASTSKSARPGIFEIEFVAPAAGSYKGKIQVKTAEFEEALADFEMTVFASVDEAKKSGTEAREEPGAPSISFLKEQQWKIPFATAFAAEDVAAPSIEVSGEVSTPPSGQADVGAAIAGRLVAPGGGFPRPGQNVKRGELLATIAPAPAAPEDGARAELAVVEAEARKQAAEAAVERVQRLISDQAISQREVDEAQRELGVAEEAVKAAKRVLGVFSGSASGSGAGSYRVTSPIAGVVVEVSATEGKSVKGGDQLFRVVDLNQLWLIARVPEQQAALIRENQDPAYKLPGLDEWLPLDVTGDDAVASVINVGRTVDRRSRTVELIYGLGKPDERLRVGAMLRIAVPAGEPWDGVVIPRSAVLTDEGRSVVYVQRDGETFEERSVRLGPISGSRAGVENGLAAGERVVTIGANIVRLSARASSAPAHGHVH